MENFGSKCYILRAYRVYNTITETVMESINVVIDDDIGAQSKWEIPQSTLEALPSPTDDVSKPSSSAIDHISIPPVSSIAADVPLDSTDVVPTEETDPTSDKIQNR